MGKKEYIIKIADSTEKREIYKIRHDVYAVELGQHATNPERSLTDKLDLFNTYIMAKKDNDVIGFISITPPGHDYSMDKYLEREELPFTFDANLFEIRLLTVTEKYRNTKIALALMYASGKLIENQGGVNIMVLGRIGISEMYKKIGYNPIGKEIQSGKVKYEVMRSTCHEMIVTIENRYRRLLDAIYKTMDWEIGVPFYNLPECCHGGAFFNSIGDSFTTLEKSKAIINADVLDAWFDPCPEILSLLKEYPAWIIKTSPPVHGEGLVRAISERRMIPENSILINSGSSSIIYLALPILLNRNSRVLILEPSYSEYYHVLKNVIRCDIDIHRLDKDRNYLPDIGEIKARVEASSYDMVLLVNPNNPTGHYIPKNEMLDLIRAIKKTTLIWIDETYIEYAGDFTLEREATDMANVIICKSMSKVYALSGIRAAYMCAHPLIVKTIKRRLPPWPLSLLSQMAAVKAIGDTEYYKRQYRLTHEYRKELAAILARNDRLKVIDGVINSLLVFVRDGDIRKICDGCRKYDLFIRPFYGTGREGRDDFLRIAIKDRMTNEKIAGILNRVLENDLV